MRYTTMMGISLCLLCVVLLHADTIRSVPQGGLWSDMATWEGGSVPADSDDAVILGTVSITDSATCHDITISDTAVLRNGDGTKWVTLRILGSVVNNGALRDNPSAQGLQVEVYGDITNNGIWGPGRTFFASRKKQTISQSITSEFNGALYKRDASGVADTFSLVAGSELWINASVFDCGRDTGSGDSWGRLDMAGNYLNLIGSTCFERARVTRVEMFSCYDSTAIKSCEFENETKLNGVITLLDSKVTFNGFTCVLGTLLNDSTQENSIVRFNNTLSNNEGHIRNHPGGGELWLDARGDMINFGVWEPARTCIASKRKQSISQFPGTEFRGDFYKRDPAGVSDTFPLVAGSDLTFSHGTFDCTQDTSHGSRLGVIDMAGYGLVLQGGNKLTGAAVSGAVMVACQESSAVGGCTFANAVALGGCFTVEPHVYFKDTVTVRDTLQSSGDVRSVHLHAAGGIVNCGTIRNNPKGSELHIEIGKNVRNAGHWMNATNVLVDSTDQVIVLDSANSIAARFSFDAVWESGPYAWYKDDTKLGDTLRILDFDSLIASSAGAYRCKRDTVWSRTITVVFDSSTVVIGPRIHAAKPRQVAGMEIVMGAADPLVRFHAPAPCSYSLCLLDITGRVVLSQTSTVAAGFHVVPLARYRLVPGTYILTLRAGTNTASGRIAVVR
ncbi:MAG: hypothetical protein JW768_08140 [Chitinispirillaceae bacterium]|nr:hypothetical protein [Chitinispirillaceae bacterium]